MPEATTINPAIPILIQNALVSNLLALSYIFTDPTTKADLQYYAIWIASPGNWSTLWSLIPPPAH